MGMGMAAAAAVYSVGWFDAAMVCRGGRVGAWCYMLVWLVCLCRIGT